MYLLCLVFWDARIAASCLRPSDTRLPDIPDQTRFLSKWYDWHRGYTLTEDVDGTQYPRMLRGEHPSDVGPGHLPRSLDHQESFALEEDLNDLHQPSRSPNAGFRDDPSPNEHPIPPEDRLFDSPSASPQVAASDSSRFPFEEVLIPPGRRRQAPSFLQPVLQTYDPRSPLSEQRLMDPHQRPYDAALASGYQVETEAHMAAQAALIILRNANSCFQRAKDNLDDARRKSRDAQRQVQEYENASRTFGTREQVESQGSDFVSPITTMFVNAQRHSTMLEDINSIPPVRQLDEGAHSHSRPSRPDGSRRNELERPQGIMTRSANPYLSNQQNNNRRPISETLETRYATVNPFISDSVETAHTNPILLRAEDHHLRRRPNRQARNAGLDSDIMKPPPKTKAEMAVDMGCKICMEQPASVACLPCGTFLTISFNIRFRISGTRSKDPKRMGFSAPVPLSNRSLASCWRNQHV